MFEIVNKLIHSSLSGLTNNTKSSRIDPYIVSLDGWDGLFEELINVWSCLITLIPLKKVCLPVYYTKYTTCHRYTQGLFEDAYSYTSNESISSSYCGLNGMVCPFPAPTVASMVWYVVWAFNLFFTNLNLLK